MLGEILGFFLCGDVPRSHRRRTWWACKERWKGGEEIRSSTTYMFSVLNSEPVSDFPLELEAILPLLPLAPNNSWRIMLKTLVEDSKSSEYSWWGMYYYGFSFYLHSSLCSYYLDPCDVVAFCFVRYVLKERGHCDKLSHYAVVSHASISILKLWYLKRVPNPKI